MVSYADHILELEANLSSDEMPPEWKWPLPWEMDDHLTKVVADRKAKYGGDDDDDDEPVGDENQLLPEWARSDA